MYEREIISRYLYCSTIADSMWKFKRKYSYYGCFIGNCFRSAH